MGIPKFYRWMSERYPLINQPGGATVVPIIDNFYLDMNGIIHNCTHGNREDVKLTEDEMIVRIFNYLDKLFHIVKPQKLIFMAIDGVAPRAKMNQQRARRFKSAREAEEAAKRAEERGEPLPDAASRFDSNCITPGTPFMARLGAHLRFFVRKKLAEDPAWQRPTVVFSGHDVPGEGEHKIMEYIRWAKRSPGYAANTRHCLYGLDADLVMLSLVTHEPHFTLLREVVSYGSGGGGQPAREVLENPCQEHFVLLQVGLLRDYLDMEFKSLASTLPFAYDLERVVDDFVLFCMLVGNDFLPALPTVDIGEGSLDAILGMYRDMLPSLGGYLTYAGELHRGRLEVFLKRLGLEEADALAARAADAEDYEAKQSKRRGQREEPPAWEAAPLPPKAATAGAAGGEEDEDDAMFALQLAAMTLTREGHELELLAAVEGEVPLEVAAGMAPAEAAPALVAAPTMMSKEARALFLDGDKVSGLAAWRQRYYREKLGVAAEEGRRSVVESYLQGLHWVLEYYYRGVASWTWFYPFHFAPMASDCTDLASVPVRFALGEPFLPYEQLLAVQPSSSCRLLPAPYRPLMTHPASPILDFYPVDFQVDMEGKRADWEGVVLIPFIDEQRLLKAARSVAPERLTAEERARNTPGSILAFTHVHGSQEDSFCTSTLPATYASVTTAHSKAVSQAAPPPLPAGQLGFTPAFVNGTKVGATGPPGFPTLRTLSVTGQLRRAGINVFGMASKKESVILTVRDMAAHMGGDSAPSAVQVASVVAGQRTWVKWPYLQEALVEAVSDGRQRAGRDGTLQPHSPMDAEGWRQQCSDMIGEYRTKQGLDLGHIELLLHVRPCDGLVRQLDGTVEKRFAKKEVAYPLQLTLRRNPTPDPRFEPQAAGAALAGEQLADGAKALFLGRAHYGSVAVVLPETGPGLGKKGEALPAGGQRGGTRRTYRVEVHPAPANAAQAAQAARRLLGNLTVNYSPSGMVARRLGVSFRTLGRITGNVWVKTGEERRDRVDVGLCVKNAGRQLYLPDYAVPLEARPNGQGGGNGGAGAGGEPNRGGWAYSDALGRVLQQYKQKYTWLWVAMEANPDLPVLTLDVLFPGMDPTAAAAQVTGLKRWLDAQPSSRRPLVKFTARVAPESAVKMLQAALPPRPRELPAVELDNVAPPLLLPPLERGGAEAALAGGTFELADRVVAAGAAGEPPFGSRGTVVGVYDDAVEVLFDQEFMGGTDLFGRCNGTCGALLPATQLLNLSSPHAVKAEGADAPRLVRRAAPPAAGSAAANNGARAAARPASASDALAAAMAGLQRKSPVARPAAAALPQPRIPDKAGTKGFSLGRGAPVAGAAAPAAASPAPGSKAGAQLLAQLQSSPKAPAAVAPTSPAASQASGSALLAQLQRAGPAAGAPPQQPQQQQGPPAHPAAPPMPVSYLPPGMMPPFMMPPPPAGMMWPPPHMPFPPGMAPPYMMPPPGQMMHPSMHAMPHPQQHGPQSPQQQDVSGAQLLSMLMEGSTFSRPAAMAPAPPPPAAAQQLPTSPQAGSLLLQRLQKAGPAGAAEGPPVAAAQLPAPPAPAPAPSAHDGMWDSMQQAPGPAPEADNGQAPPPPPPSSSLLNAVMPGAVVPAAKSKVGGKVKPQAAAVPPPAAELPPPSADDLWKLLSGGA